MYDSIYMCTTDNRSCTILYTYVLLITTHVRFYTYVYYQSINRKLLTHTYHIVHCYVGFILSTHVYVQYISPAG